MALFDAVALSKRVFTEEGGNSHAPYALPPANKSLRWADYASARTLHDLSSSLKSEMIPIRDCIQRQRKTSLRFPSPHRPDPEQHHMT
jgi:hypothetical protein